MNESYTQYWDRIAQAINDEQHFDELVAEQFRRVYLNLLKSWADIGNDQNILKTGLFAEAFCPSRAFMLDVLQDGANVVGIDVSMEIAIRAKRMIFRNRKASFKALNCDVRKLPFANNSFDLIISDSTLDHFSRKSDIQTALSELGRVLKPGGTMILTLDNAGNIAEPLFRLWIRLGFASIFLGKTYTIRELKEAVTNVGLDVSDSTAIIHNPRFVTWTMIRIIRKVAPRKFNHFIRQVLILLDKLEGLKTKFITGQFIAIKVLKPHYD